MFRSFTVKNFRCFQDLTIAPLARVNLIAGKNNVGKTALLEALYLHSGPRAPRSPQVFEFLRPLERFRPVERHRQPGFGGRVNDEEAAALPISSIPFDRPFLKIRSSPRSQRRFGGGQRA